MRTRAVAILVALAMAVTAQGELHFKELSVTATSQTYPIPNPAKGILICGYGTDEVYFRLFWSGEIPAAATTANNLLIAGTATAPQCKSYDQPPQGPWSAISIVCDTAETATVRIESY